MLQYDIYKRSLQSCLYAVFRVESQLVSKVGVHWVSMAVLKLFLKIVLHLVSSTVVQCFENVGTGYDIKSKITTLLSFLTHLV